MHPILTSKGFYIAAVFILLGCSCELRRSDNFNISFVIEPRDEVVSIGSRVELGCLVSNEIPHVVKWYFDGIRIEPLTNQRQFQNGSLVMSKFDSSNVGEYLCMVTSGQFARVSNSVTIQAAALKAPKESTRKRDKKIKEGENALLPCAVEGTPTPSVVWKKDFQPIFLDDRIVLLPSKALHIIEARTEDHGLYECNAYNKAGDIIAAVFNVTLSHGDVKSNITLLSDRTKVDSFLGHQVVLECLWGISQSVWYRDGSRLEHRSKLGSSLVLENATFSDSGVYTCTSSEDEGVSTEITLSIFAPPLLLTQHEFYVNSRMGKTINLTCNFIGNLEPDVRWFKDGKVLQELGRLKINSLKSIGQFIYKSEVLVYHSNLSDSGIYQCRIFNNLGSKDVTYFVSVTKPVFMIPPPQDLKARPALNREIELSWNPPSDVKGQITYSIHYWSSYDDNELQLPTERSKETIIHLLPFMNYTFYVKAHVNGEVSEPSHPVSQMTNEEVPISIPRFTLEADGASTIVLRWGNLSNRQAKGIIVNHKILLRTFKESFTKMFGVDGSVYNHTLSGLKPENRYDVLVLSGTKIGFPNIDEIEPEQWQSIYLSEDPASPLYYPEDLKVVVINSSSIAISWQVKHLSNSVELYGFRILFQSPGRKPRTVFTRDSDRSYFLNNLESGRSYELKINSESRVGPGTPAISYFATPALPTTTNKYSNKMPIVLKGEALNDTSIALSFAYESIEEDDVKMCYGVYDPLKEIVCNEWMAVDASDEIYVTNLWPLTKYYFGIHGENHWLSNIITCSTGLPVPTNLQFADVGDQLNISWSFPDVIEANVRFRVSYTDDLENPESIWFHESVNGSAQFFVLENYTSNKGYFIRVTSVLGDVESDTSNVLRVEAREGTQGHLASHHPISVAMIIVVVVVGILISVVLAVVLGIRRRLRLRKQKDCYNKDSTHLASIKPFQSKVELENTRECNGNHYYRHRRSDTVTGEPLLGEQSEPVLTDRGALSTSQETSVQMQKFNESTV